MPESDQLYGGSGTDSVFGQYGDDFIDARDGIPDTVQAGPGHDTCLLTPWTVRVTAKPSEPDLIVQPPRPARSRRLTEFDRERRGLSRMYSRCDLRDTSAWLVSPRRPTW
jgi:hypothetical protein